MGNKPWRPTEEEAWRSEGGIYQVAGGGSKAALRREEATSLIMGKCRDEKERRLDAGEEKWSSEVPPCPDEMHG